MSKFYKYSCCRCGFNRIEIEPPPKNNYETLCTPCLVSIDKKS